MGGLLRLAVQLSGWLVLRIQENCTPHLCCCCLCTSKPQASVKKKSVAGTGGAITSVDGQSILTCVSESNLPKQPRRRLVVATGSIVGAQGGKRSLCCE
jgi:hypothetical protein